MNNLTGFGSAVLLLVLIVAAVAAYALPSLIAYSRKTRNRASVLVLNIGLGWTVIGWIAALAMAVAGQ